MSDSPFTLFYAWQSDTPSIAGRNFVEDAANKALKRIHASGVLDLAPRLDKDTKDIPGMPDIANTILDKIRTATAILADLSFVGKDQFRSGGEEKLLPNPNVLLELGYGIAHLTWDRVICVMNTHYGQPEDLPFDLRHRRWPLSYSLAPDADEASRKAVKQQLIKELERAITGIVEAPFENRRVDVDSRLEALESLVSSMSGTIGQLAEVRNSVDRIQRAVVRDEEERNSPENRAKAVLKELVEQVKSEKLDGIRYTQGMFGLAILPISPPGSALPLFEREREVILKLRPLYSSGWDYRRHSSSFVTYSRRGDVIDAVSEITDEGVVRAAGHEVISVSTAFLAGSSFEEGIHVIPSVAFEQAIIEAIHQYIALLEELGAPGPWMVGMSLFNLGKSILFAGHRFSFEGKAYMGDSLSPPPVLLPAEVDFKSPQNVARALRPAFDYIWREFNYPQSLNYGEGGDWVGR